MASTESSLGRFTSIRVLVPGTGTRFRCGGLSVALQTARLLSRLRPTQLVTYRQRQSDHPFLDDLLQQDESSEDVLWMVSWGFDVPLLLRRLKGRPPLKATQKQGYIKTPTHHPKHVFRTLVLLQQVIEERMIRLTLAVGDQLRGPQPRQQPGRLQGNA